MPCSQVRERATTEKWPRRTRTSARCPRAHAPPPPFAAWPTLLMPLRRTLRTEVWSPSWQDGVVEVTRSDKMEVDEPDVTLEVCHRHADPMRAARPRRSLCCSVHWHLPTLVLCRA